MAFEINLTAVFVIIAVVCIPDGTTIYNMTPFHTLHDPRVTKNPLSPPAVLKPYTTCSKKPFGLNGLTLSVCKTSIYYNTTTPPVVSWRLGRLDQKAKEAVARRYSGIFRSRLSMAAQDSSRRTSDNDLCCPTDHHLERAPERTDSIRGVTFDIVFLDSTDSSLYQYYQVGRCLLSSTDVGCRGTCVQMTSTVYLMVFSQDSVEPFSFEAFEVPSYCSCQNIGSSSPRKGVVHGKTPNSTEQISSRDQRAIKEAMSKIFNDTILTDSSSSTPVLSNNTLPDTTNKKIPAISRKRMSGIYDSEMSDKSYGKTEGRYDGSKPSESYRGKTGTIPKAIPDPYTILDLANVTFTTIFPNSDIINNTGQKSGSTEP